MMKNNENKQVGGIGHTFSGHIPLKNVLKMVAYTGTKQVLAIPMSRGEYNNYQGWTIPENEDPSEQGFLIEYLNGGKANHPDHEGYISWSPKDVFENSYKIDDPSEPCAMGSAINDHSVDYLMMDKCRFLLEVIRTSSNDESFTAVQKKANSKLSDLIGSF